MIIIGLAETNHSLSWSSWLKNTSHKFTDIHDHHWIGWNQSFLIMIIMAKNTSHKFTDIHDHHWIGWNQSFLIMIIMAKKHHTNSLTFMIIIGLAETNHSLSWSSWLKKHHTNSLTFMIIIGLAETNHSLSWSSWLKKHHTNSLTFMIIIGLAETNHSLSWSSWLKKHHTNSLTFMIIIGLAETNHSLSWSSLDWLKPYDPMIYHRTNPPINCRISHPHHSHRASLGGLSNPWDLRWRESTGSPQEPPTISCLPSPNHQNLNRSIGAIFLTFLPMAIYGNIWVVSKHDIVLTTSLVAAVANDHSSIGQKSCLRRVRGNKIHEGIGQWLTRHQWIKP